MWPFLRIRDKWFWALFHPKGAPQCIPSTLFTSWSEGWFGFPEAHSSYREELCPTLFASLP